MTIKAALQSAVKYQMESNELDRILIDRGLDGTQAYEGTSMAFQLAQADCIALLVTAPNISEGGYSISLADKASLMKLASGIYTKWGETSSLIDKPTITAINAW